MSKAKKSGPAIFMYCVIAITVTTSIVCFSLYYGNIYKSKATLNARGNVRTLRGYVGTPILGRTVSWVKVDEK